MFNHLIENEEYILALKEFKSIKMPKEYYNDIINTLNSKEEHNQVLFELGLLDDMDDWELYQKQEQELDVDIDNETYWKWVK